jgi:endonuclease YncB( thermonuclease family)
MRTVSAFAALMSLAAASDKTIEIPAGDTVTGRCVGVHDGDSITLLLDTPAGKRQVRIRLDGIDAPELGQPFSRIARAALSEMVSIAHEHAEAGR